MPEPIEFSDVLSFRLTDPNAQAPQRSRQGDNGYDIRCLEDFTLAPGKRALVGTGVEVALPNGYAGLVVPRSGLALKHGVTVVNGPGLIDENYRGPLGVILINTDPYSAFHGSAGDRIAQLLLVEAYTPPVEVVDVLPEHHDLSRGAGGFGSSGVA